jgi:pimeloyl-ACP methyl ester carboxylesterase
MIGRCQNSIDGVSSPMGPAKGEHDNADNQDQGQYEDLLEGLGNGTAVVFSHGWPLSADAWEDQMLFLAARGYRCAAHDRRGHGRSSQPWNGNEMDTYADDLAALVENLDLKNAIHVGHSTGVAKSRATSAVRAPSASPRPC